MSDELGVIGRADRFVESALEIAPLVRRLLGSTWLVENLTQALALAEKTRGAGMHFVTLAGEVLSADGTLVAGQRSAAAGLISRRSELRTLRFQIAEQERKIAEIAEIAASLEQQVAMQEQLVNESADAHQAAHGALMEHRLRIRAAGQRRDQLLEEQNSLQAEFKAATVQVEIVTKSLEITRQRLEQLQSSLAQAEARMSDNSRRIEELDSARNNETAIACRRRLSWLAASSSWTTCAANCGDTSKIGTSAIERLPKREST